MEVQLEPGSLKSRSTKGWDMYFFPLTFFFFSCENHKFQLIDFFVCQKVNTFPVWFYVSARNTLNETFSTFSIKLLSCSLESLGVPLVNSLLKYLSCSYFYFPSLVPLPVIAKWLCHHLGAKADFKQAARLLYSEYLVQYMLSC